MRDCDRLLLVDRRKVRRVDVDRDQAEVIGLRLLDEAGISRIDVNVRVSLGDGGEVGGRVISGSL